MTTRRSIATALTLATLLAVPCVAPAIGAWDGPETGTLRIWNGQAGLSLRGSVGYLNGEARELVYSDLDGYRHQVSELIWDLRDLAMVGISGSAHFARRFHVRAAFWTAANEGGGQMEDYDWLMYEPDSPWTDYSLSDVDVTSASIVDLAFAVDIVSYKGFTLRGLAGYKQDYWAWSDYGVRHVYSSDPYSPGGFRDDVADEDGSTGIEYEQIFRVPYLGGELEFARGAWEANAYLKLSPIVTADDEDLHVHRHLLFEESFDGGTFVAAGVQVLRTFESGLYVAGAFDFQTIPEFDGDMTITDLDTGEVWSESDSAGISHFAYMLSLSLGYAF